MAAIPRIILHYQWAKLFSKIIFQNYWTNNAHVGFWTVGTVARSVTDVI